MTAFIAFASFIVGIITGAAGYVMIFYLAETLKNTIEEPHESTPNIQNIREICKRYYGNNTNKKLLLEVFTMKSFFAFTTGLLTGVFGITMAYIVVEGMGTFIEELHEMTFE